MHFKVLFILSLISGFQGADVNVLDEHKKIQCNFVVSALVHIHLIETYLLEPEKVSQLSEQEINNITFTVEAQSMVNYAYNKKDTCWKDITEVMWIFYLYNIRAEMFIQSYRDGTKHYSKYFMLSTHKAIKIVLEEYTISSECEIYNSDSDELEGVMLSFAGVTIERSGTVIQLAVNQKIDRLLKQETNNYLDDPGIERFQLKRLQLDDFFKIKDIKHQILIFWVPSYQWNIRYPPCQWSYCYPSSYMEIWYSLEECFEQTRSLNIPLYKYTEYLIKLTLHFRTILKAIAMRIIILYLIYKKHSVRDPLNPFHLRSRKLNSYNNQIIAGLNEFAIRIGQHNDHDMKITIEILKKLKGSEIDSHINSIMNSLKSMASVNKDFAPITNEISLYKNLARKWLAEILERIQYHSKCNNLNNLYGPNILKNIVNIYVEFSQETTKSIDFGVVDSMTSLENSNHYKLLKELETDNKKTPIAK